PLRIVADRRLPIRAILRELCGVGGKQGRRHSSLCRPGPGCEACCRTRSHRRPCIATYTVESGVDIGRQRMKLEERAALITGGSRGLGLAIAGALGREGASVALMARPGAELSAAVARLEGAGASVMEAPADVTREAEVEAATKAVVAA